MYCNKCGKEIENDSIFCMYCGKEVIFEKTETFDEVEQELKKEKNHFENNKAISIEKKQIFLKKIFILYFITIILSNLFFIPFQPYAVSKSISKPGQITKLNEDKEYHHIYNLPEEVENIVIRPKGSDNNEEAKLIYKVVFAEMILRFAAITVLFVGAIVLYKKRVSIQKRKINKAKILIFSYVVSFVIITIFLTPYRQFVTSNGNLLFTGTRGYSPIFMFNDLEKTYNEIMCVYYIDSQVLFVELLSLTILFIGAWLIFKSVKNKV